MKNKKIIVVFGPPGAGKGTVATYLEKFKFSHLSTGHILRTEFYQNPRYKNLQKDLESGLFASDSLVIKIVEDFLDNHEYEKHGVILDGFPRDLKQAKALEQILEGRNFDLSIVVDIQIPQSVIIKRIVGRYSCANCEAVYNEKSKPTKVEGVCDHCGATELYKRKEDDPKVLDERMNQYFKRTEPIIDFYKEKGLLIRVDGDCDIKTIEKRIKKILKSKEIV